MGVTDFFGLTVTEEQAAMYSRVAQRVAGNSSSPGNRFYNTCLDMALINIKRIFQLCGLHFTEEALYDYVTVGYGFH